MKTFGFKKPYGITLAELERLVATNKHMVAEVANFTYKFSDRSVFLTVSELWGLVFGDKKARRALIAIWTDEKIAYDALLVPAAPTSREEVYKTAINELDSAEGEEEESVDDAGKENEKIDILLAKIRFEVLDEIKTYMVQKSKNNKAEKDAKDKADAEAAAAQAASDERLKILEAAKLRKMEADVDAMSIEDIDKAIAEEKAKRNGK